MKEILLKKPKARTAILFKPSKEDDWFIYVIHFECKSGKQTSKVMIIQKDMNQWIEGYLSKGWVISTDVSNLGIDLRPKKKKDQEVETDEDPPF